MWRRFAKRQHLPLPFAVGMMCKTFCCVGRHSTVPEPQEQIVTPFAQILHTLKSVHKNYMTLTNVSSNRSVPERVTFKLCVMVYRCLHGIGPEYFSEDFRLVSEIQSRQRLRSASSTDVVVPATRRSSLGDRAFPVAGARAQAWNALPASVTAALSLSSFRRLLKTFLSQRQRRQ